MTDHRDDPLADLEAELQAALDVDPSPAFAARVRTEIDRVRVARSFRRWVTAAAVVSAALLMLWVQTREARESMADAPRMAATTEPLLAPGLNTTSMLGALPVAPRATGDVRPVGWRRGRAAVAPEVLVSPDEAVALRRLVALFSEGRIALRESVLHDSVMEATPLEPVAHAARVDVTPLQVEPVEVDPHAAEAVPDPEG